MSGPTQRSGKESARGQNRKFGSEPHIDPGAAGIGFHIVAEEIIGSPLDAENYVGLAAGGPSGPNVLERTKYQEVVVVFTKPDDPFLVSAKYSRSYLVGSRHPKTGCRPGTYLPISS